MLLKTWGIGGGGGREAGWHTQLQRSFVKLPPGQWLPQLHSLHRPPEMSTYPDGQPLNLECWQAGAGGGDAGTADAIVV